ncbi:MAG: KTSC domain-containing protein [Chloroflexi bacterium]|nr:KTSC domain-containing protein [Chloroflexota bacterium]
MNRSLVASSNVRSIGYDRDSETLEIEFNSGSIYQYFGVPEQMYDEIMRAPSKGRFVHQYIRNQYAYSRVG